MTELSTIAGRVARGAGLLDRWEPGWAAEIVEEDLDLQSPSYCVLGQVYGDYDDGLAHLDLSPGDPSADCGFTIMDPDIRFYERLNALADAWRAEIARRLPTPTEGPPP